MGAEGSENVPGSTDFGPESKVHRGRRVIRERRLEIDQTAGVR